MKINEIIVEAETYQPPELEVGDKILKGKFKNSPATIKGFTKDKHNQPVLKTDKGSVQLFKPRVTKLMTNEGLSHPVICVDVQPEYNGYDGEANPQFVKIMQFVAKQTGPVLFFVNAEDMGLSGDTVQSIQHFWDSTLVTPGEEGEDENGDYFYKEAESPIDWRRFTVVDKGFGYLRSWHDQGVSDAAIIKAIRLMYQSKVSDSRDLFNGDGSNEYEEGMKQLLGTDYLIGMSDPISVNWTSVAQLKKFNGAYLVGGGRNECLWEIRILMNSFNIRCKLIDSLIYG